MQVAGMVAEFGLLGVFTRQLCLRRIVSTQACALQLGSLSCLAVNGCTILSVSSHHHQCRLPSDGTSIAMAGMLACQPLHHQALPGRQPCCLVCPSCSLMHPHPRLCCAPDCCRVPSCSTWTVMALACPAVASLSALVPHMPTAYWTMGG